MAHFVKVRGDELRGALAGLTARQHRVLLAYRALSWKSPAGYKKIARRLGVDRANVRKALAQLRKLGLLTTEGGVTSTPQGGVDVDPPGGGDPDPPGGGATLTPQGGVDVDPPSHSIRHARRSFVDLKTRSFVDPPSGTQETPKAKSTKRQRENPTNEQTNLVNFSKETIQAFRETFPEVVTPQLRKMLAYAVGECVAESVDPPTPDEWRRFALWARNDSSLNWAPHRLSAALLRLVERLTRWRKCVKNTTGNAATSQKDSPRQESPLLPRDQVGGVWSQFMSSVNRGSLLLVE